MDISQCRKYFFNICHGFSIRYEALATSEGARFRQECKAAGKKICSWTVNDPEEMRQCARWGIASVISDKPDLWRKIRLDVGLGSSGLCYLEIADDFRRLRPTGPRLLSLLFNLISHPSSRKRTGGLITWVLLCAFLNVCQLISILKQRLAKEETEYLEREAGTFDIPVPHVEMHIATPGYWIIEVEKRVKLYE